MKKHRKQFILPILAASMMYYFMSAAGYYTEPHAQLVGGGGLRTSLEMKSNSPSANNLTTNVDGRPTKCKDLREAAGGVLLGRIMPCLTYTISHTTESFSEATIDWFKPLVYSFLVLVITLFGVRILQGEREIHQQGFMLILKISIILGVFELIPHYFVPAAYGILNESISIITSTLGPESSSISCDINKFGDGNTLMLWKQMDCVLGKLYGFTTGDSSVAGGSAPNMVLASSVFGLLAGFFAGGSFGVALFFMCMGLLISMFMLVIRVALAYINGYMIICILCIISPLFLPLILLRVTTQNFDKWWQAILGGFLLPIVMTSYAMFAMQLYDKMMFADDSLLIKLFDNELVAKAEKEPHKACDYTVAGSTSQRAADPKSRVLLDKIYSMPFFQSFTNPTGVAGNNACGMFSLPSFDPQELDKDKYESKKEAFEKLFKDVFKLFLLGYLILRSSELITRSLRLLIGSTAATRSLNIASAQEQKWQAQIQGAQGAFKREIGNASGADFLGKIPEAMKASTKELLGRK